MQRIPIIRLEGEEVESLVKVLDQVSSWSRAPKSAPYLIFGLIVLAWVSGNVTGVLLFLSGAPKIGTLLIGLCWAPGFIEPLLKDVNFRTVVDEIKARPAHGVLLFFVSVLIAGHVGSLLLYLVGLESAVVPLYLLSWALFLLAIPFAWIFDSLGWV